MSFARSGERRSSSRSRPSRSSLENDDVRLFGEIAVERDEQGSDPPCGREDDAVSERDLWVARNAQPAMQDPSFDGVLLGHGLHVAVLADEIDWGWPVVP